ncbi:MAG: hypothetical protein ACOYW9_00215 [Deinococcota bacterium]
MLKYELEEIERQKKPTLLLVEAQLRLKMYLSLAYQQSGDFEAALREADQAKLLASALALPQAHHACMNLIACSLHGLGRMSEMHSLLQTALDSQAIPRLQADFRRQLADVVFFGGNLEGALSLLSEVPTLDKSLTWPEAYGQFYKALEGVGGREERALSNHSFAALTVPLVEALHQLAKALGLPRSQEHMAKRKQLLKVALEHARSEALDRDPWARIIGGWLQGTVYRHLGRHRKAVEIVDEIPKPFPESFTARLLLAGLRLELALGMQTGSGRAIRSFEDELRQVFDDARKTAFAVPSGLARRLVHWHPLAATYAAVMPTPIGELVWCREIILRVEPPCQVYGAKVDPAFMAELVLRSLDVDLVEGGSFVSANLNSRIRRKQRDVLLSDYGEVKYWRPVVSAIQLAFGLACSAQGNQTYFEAAREVVSEFGLIPRQRGDYQADRLQNLASMTQGLINQEITPAEFAVSFNELF